MIANKHIIKWQDPTEQIIQRVGSYVTNNLDYPKGFGRQNPHHHKNHTRLHKHIGLKHIQWLSQSHSSVVCRAPTTAYVEADACWTSRSYVACGVLTADCLPVFFTDAEATRVAVAHAGWRGLAAGILQKTLACFPSTSKIFVAFGPAISQSNYEVGKELIETFPEHTEAFKPIKNTANDKYLLSLYELAASILEQHGVVSPIIPKWCTFSSKDSQDGSENNQQYLFPSHRRDKDANSVISRNARVANLIWLK